MSRTADIESDPFFELLTDALRAGPGTPQWHQAVQRLKSEGLAGADEYRLLYEARENLESGKDYRAVRAGAGFTRKLFSELEGESPGGGAPTANLVAALSAVAILGVLGLVAYLLIRGSGVRPEAPGPDLASMYFPADVAAATFAGRVPVGWRTIGNLPLETDKTLRPMVVPMAAGDYVGGGVILEDPVPAAEPFALEAVVRIPQEGGDFIAEVFVADSADFDDHRATSPNELVWLLEGQSQKAMVGGRNQGRVEPTGTQAGPATLTVRLVVDRDRGLVESRPGEPAGGGKATVLWSGIHGLSPERPRYAGVRFIRGSGGSRDVASVKSLRVVGRGPTRQGPEGR